MRLAISICVGTWLAWHDGCFQLDLVKPLSLHVFRIIIVCTSFQSPLSQSGDPGGYWRGTRVVSFEMFICPPLTCPEARYPSPREMTHVRSWTPGRLLIGWPGQWTYWHHTTFARIGKMHAPCRVRTTCNVVYRWFLAGTCTWSTLSLGPGFLMGIMY